MDQEYRRTVAEVRAIPACVVHNEMPLKRTKLGEAAGRPIEAAQRLGNAAIDGRLEALAEMHDLALVVMFGSASRGELDARDLDVAAGSRASG